MLETGACAEQPPPRCIDVHLPPLPRAEHLRGRGARHQPRPHRGVCEGVLCDGQGRGLQGGGKGVICDDYEASILQCSKRGLGVLCADLRRGLHSTSGGVQAPRWRFGFAGLCATE